MKRKYFNRMAGFNTTIRIGCAASIGMMTAQLQAGVTEEAPILEEETAEVPPNWVDVTVGGAFVGGDEAAFQRRVGVDGDFYGGISDMHLETTVDDLTWTLDGHAMFGNEDYELILGLQKDDLGYIEAGYREFRTWYDGSGGWMPGLWYDNDDELHLDRGEVWFEAGLRIEDFPEITFNYTHSWRDGQKDSTSWGYTTLSDFHIAPSLYDIDETSDTFTLEIADEFMRTDYDIGLVYRRIRNDDTRTESYVHDVDNNGPLDPENITVNDSLSYDADMFSGHLGLTRRFGEKLMASFGYSYTNLDTDIGGQRQGLANATNNLYTGAAHALWGLSGGAEANINVLNASLWWNPTDNIVIVPSIRAEFWDQSADGWHVAGERNRDVGFDSGSGANPVDVVNAAVNGRWPTGLDEGYLAEVRDRSSNDWNELTEALEIRYDGIQNTLLYTSLEFTQSDGDYFHSTFEDVHDGSATSYGARWTDSDLDVQKYTIGANWYPIRNLSFAAQAYYREYDQDLDSRFEGSGEDAQINKHKNETTDFNLRMTWRALPCLTFVTRYDYLQTDIDNRGYDNQVKYPKTVQSADIESNVISQTVTWMPLSQMYIQGFVSYTSSETDTPANDWVPASITDSDNDYLTANLTVGYAIDNKTDITASYSYYYADNYDLPSAGVGYGTTLEEHVFGIRLNRWINPNMVWNVGYGYYNSNDGTFGGNNSFDAQMISTGLQVRF